MLSTSCAWGGYGYTSGQRGLQARDRGVGEGGFASTTHDCGVGCKKTSGGAHKVPREQGLGGQRRVGGAGRHAKAETVRSLTKKIVEIELKVYSRGVHHFFKFSQVIHQNECKKT